MARKRSSARPSNYFLFHVLQTLIPSRRLRSYERTIGYACFNLVKEFGTLGYKGKVLVITASGYTARMISKYRPDVPIVALSPNLRTVRELVLVWGVRSVRSLAPAGRSAVSHVGPRGRSTLRSTSHRIWRAVR